LSNTLPCDRPDASPCTLMSTVCQQQRLKQAAPIIIITSSTRVSGCPYVSHNKKRNRNAMPHLASPIASMSSETTANNRDPKSRAGRARYPAGCRKEAYGGVWLVSDSEHTSVVPVSLIRHSGSTCAGFFYQTMSFRAVFANRLESIELSESNASLTHGPSTLGDFSPV
jgi:hypothetical protein